jgi:dihydrofolate reductase
MSVSLDGFIETSDRKIDWVIVDEELHTFWNAQAREQSVFLYGRRMYELMSVWPKLGKDPSSPAYIVEFAQIWENKPKIVFSKTLKEVAWNSRLVGVDDIAEEIMKLKAKPGKDMGVGGPTLAASFIKLGLVDEYQLFINPIVLGAGTPFFPPLVNKIDLKLVETRTFRSGVVYVRFLPSRE